MNPVMRMALLLWAVPLVSLADNSKPASTNVAACRAAFHAEDYGSSLPISNALQQMIASYRSHWQQFCSGDRTVALDALFIEAQDVEEKFWDVRSLWEESEGDPGERGDQIHHALTVTLPSFIPAFLGWYMEYAEFRPVLVDFREASALGTEEDVQFFQVYTPLHGDTGNPPWIQLETDYSGCVRFGEYDWVGALKTAADLRKETKSAIYLKLIDQFVLDLLEPLTEESGEVHACSGDREVISDLLMVRNYTKSHDAATTKNIEGMITAIRSGAITIR